MTLRFKRNYPLVLMLAAILSMLALTMGSQPVTSYTVGTEILQTTQLAAIYVDVSNAMTGIAGIFNPQTTGVSLQAVMLGGTLNLIQP